MFRQNLLKTYMWQVLSIVLSFVSMFVVTPALSADKSLYGVYIACLSLTMFLSYCDFGFVASGTKFAAEAYARNDHKEEMHLVGFTTFLLLIMVIPFILVALTLSIHPEWLLKGIVNSVQHQIASRLLLLLILPSITLLPMRIAVMILGIRIREYIFRRYSSIGSIISIGSVPFLFRAGNYPIVEYFFIVQCMALFAALASLLHIHFKITPLSFGRQVRFSKMLFAKTGRLATASLIGTIAWILYFELDTVYISKALGPQAVATFAIALTTTSFMRSLLGNIYSPFIPRMNHFLGVNDEQGLKNFLKKILSFMMPATILGVLVVTLLYKDLVLAWVGLAYLDSVAVGVIYFSIYFLSPLQYLGGNLMNAMQRNRDSILLSLLLTLVYWSGVLLSVDRLGVLSIAVFKLVAFILSGTFYGIYIFRFIGAPLQRAQIYRILKLMLIGGSSAIGIYLSRWNGTLPFHRLHIGAVFISGAFWWLGGMAVFFLWDHRLAEMKQMLPRISFNKRISQ